MNTQKFIERLAKLHALLGSANPGERETARVKLNELLEQHRKSWNDLPELLALSRQGQHTANAQDAENDAGQETVPRSHGIRRRRS
jgi:hypothetical protein